MRGLVFRLFVLAIPMSNEFKNEVFFQLRSQPGPGVPPLW